MENKQYVIVIDEGHGGHDPGVVSSKGQKESKTNQNVGRKLGELCEIAGYKVVYTRNGDTYVGINDRAKIINASKPDLCISIHHNGGKGDGSEVFYQVKNPKSKKLAQFVIDEFSKLNNVRGIKIKESKPGVDYFGILRMSRCPAIITEFAFLDSNDITAVDTLKEQWAEAEAIFKSIRKYFA